MSVAKRAIPRTETDREISSDGRWFRDSQHRYCLFRGVNIDSRSKTKPYLPIVPEDLNSHRTEKGLSRLKRLGYNVVRLVVPWKAFAEEIPQEDLTASSLGLVKSGATAVDMETLVVAKPQSLTFELVAQHAILFLKMVDDV